MTEWWREAHSKFQTEKNEGLIWSQSLLGHDDEDCWH